MGDPNSCMGRSSFSLLFFFFPPLLFSSSFLCFNHFLFTFNKSQSFLEYVSNPNVEKPLPGDSTSSGRRKGEREAPSVSYFFMMDSRGNNSTASINECGAHKGRECVCLCVKYVMIIDNEEHVLVLFSPQTPRCGR